MTEYSALTEEKQNIIAGGVKRDICQTRGLITNLPSDVPEICQDYGLM